MLSGMSLSLRVLSVCPMVRRATLRRWQNWQFGSPEFGS